MDGEVPIGHPGVRQMQKNQDRQQKAYKGPVLVKRDHLVEVVEGGGLGGTPGGGAVNDQIITE